MYSLWTLKYFLKLHVTLLILKAYVQMFCSILLGYVDKLFGQPLFWLEKDSGLLPLAGNSYYQAGLINIQYPKNKLKLAMLLCLA